MKILHLGCWSAFASLAVAEPAWAGFSGLGDNLTIVWVAVAAALVFLMQAGFALLEAGMARSKNSINVIMKNYADMAAGALAFWVLGFGLLYGANQTGWLGMSLFLPALDESGDAVFFLYQTMFAATAATIISGAVAERIRFAPYFVLSLVVTTLIYPVSGSWVWGGLAGGAGWLSELGFHDFAGGTVVHGVGGWVALAGIIVLGPRVGRFGRDGSVRAVPGHNLTLVALGVFILWFGWFGFNGGSTFDATSNIGMVMVNTHLGAGAGVVSALLAMWIFGHGIYITSTLNGGLGGLVAVTAGADVLSTGGAIVTGLIAGPITVGGWRLLELLSVDDVVGAVPVHGFCGMWGTLAVALFSVEHAFVLNQLLLQAIGTVAICAWAFIAGLIAFVVVRAVMGLRTSDIDEQRGLDYTEHYEEAYPEFH